jgi:galactonate dehydratase
LLVGQDPRRIEHLWQRMYRHPYFKGGTVELSAISGIDQALNDITAKDLGVPLMTLLGGAVRDRVRMYDHLGGGDPEAVYHDARVAAFAEHARQSVSDGYRALKILAVPSTPGLPDARRLREAETLMAATRDAVGPDVDIMVDFHGRTTAAAAIAYTRVLEPFDPWFIEEPCQPEDVDGLALVARSTAIPVATGERLGTRYAFRELFEKRACAVAQPDVCHCGGITELRKIAALADIHFVTMAPHNPLGPVATMANVHAAFATPNFLIQEHMRNDVPWRAEVVDADLTIEQGQVLPPTRPGLGVEIDEAAAARHPAGVTGDYGTFHDDGAVADW